MIGRGLDEIGVAGLQRREPGRGIGVKAERDLVEIGGTGMFEQVVRPSRSRGCGRG